MLSLLLCGIAGTMGQVLIDTIAKTKDYEITGGIDPFAKSEDFSYPVAAAATLLPEGIRADALIDFSRPAALHDNIAYARKAGIPLVIATTGYSDEDKAYIAESAKTMPIFFTANMSLGVNLQIELCRQAAGFFADTADVEIVEKHHNRKVDAPSGTAIAIAEAVNKSMGGNKDFTYGREGRNCKRQPNEIGIHAVRGGSIVGQHETLFITDEEIVEINHRSESKNVFARGALRAASYMQGKPNGLYSMTDILYETRTMTDLFVSENEALITVDGVDASPKAIADIFNRIADSDINVDIISQSAPAGGKITVSFSLSSSDVQRAIDVLKTDYVCRADTPLTKLTVEGLGMEYRHGVAAKLFSILAEQNVAIFTIATSERKISFCVSNEDAQKATRSMAEMFGLRVK